MRTRSSTSTAAILLLTASLAVASFLALDGLAPTRCDICQNIAKQAKQVGKETESQTKERALKGASTYQGEQEQLYIDELNCHWAKYYSDANLDPHSTTLATCADTGFCPIQYQETPYEYIDLTNDTSDYYSDCITPQIILLHHTVTPTANDTVETLKSRGLSVQYIVGRAGRVYKMVDDWHGAWHGGAGNWRTISSINRNSTGIEIVNRGNEPFSKEQVDSVIKLVGALRKRWWINDDYIIGHAEIAPSRKDDPSGYFPWNELQRKLKIHPRVFSSKLSNEQKKKVIIKNSTSDFATINRVQKGLARWGYTNLNMTTNVISDNMLFTMMTFNRRYCPEIFVKEQIDNATDLTIHEMVNSQWYGISDERLNYLLNNMKK